MSRDYHAEYIANKAQLVELSKKQDELFLIMFTPIGDKRTMKPEEYVGKAKYNVSKCAVGDWLQTQSHIYERVI